MKIKVTQLPSTYVGREVGAALKSLGLPATARLARLGKKRQLLFTQVIGKGEKVTDIFPLDYKMQGDIDA